jgi:hypothetical protein
MNQPANGRVLFAVFIFFTAGAGVAAEAGAATVVGAAGAGLSFIIVSMTALISIPSLDHLMLLQNVPRFSRPALPDLKP